MKIKGITDIFFDLDHTLWDFDKNSALTFKKIFKLYNVDVNADEFLLQYVPINLKYWKLYRDAKIDTETLRFDRLNETFKAVNFEVEDDLVHTLSHQYIAHLSTFTHVFENTFEILDYLKVNYTLHIITNGFDELQQKKMKHSKIDHYFKTVTTADSAGVKKPNPIIFEYALNSAKVEADKSVMIGDSYEADIIGASNVGMDTIYFRDFNTALAPEIKQIDRLIELKKYL